MEDFYSSVLLCPFHSSSYFLLIYHYIFVDLLWQSQFGLLVLAVFWTSRFSGVFENLLWLCCWLGTADLTPSVTGED